MRLFIALDIDDAIRERIQRFLEGIRDFAPDARWAKPESLHVTLKFIGEQPPATVDSIKEILSQIKRTAFGIVFRGHGFFPTVNAPRVFWIGIEAGPQLATLAKEIDDSIHALGIPKEDRPFSPHLTLARGGKSGAPHRQKGDRRNQNFIRLQEKLATFPLPDFGTMRAREFFLYQSKLSPSGSQYSKLERFPLDG